MNLNDNWFKHMACYHFKIYVYNQLTGIKLSIHGISQILC